MIKTYRKTEMIKAEQFDGSKALIDKYPIGVLPVMQIDQFGDLNDENNWSEPVFHIRTLKGMFRLRVGDWIATGTNGERWLIADDVFKQRCKELPVIPQSVADWIELGKSKRVSLDTALLLTLYEKQKTYGNELARWIMHGNLATVARAWLDGYQVEVDK